MSRMTVAVLVLTAAFPLAGCAPHSAQVLTPVRLDTTRIPAAAPPPTVTRPVATVADDPFHRIDRMDWPGPNEYRDASGSPGPEYWQQRADYTIAASLDTTSKSIRGTVSIRYTNNSPDTLRFVWLPIRLAAWHLAERYRPRFLQRVAPLLPLVDSSRNSRTQARWLTVL